MTEVRSKHGQSQEKPNVVRECNEGMSSIDGLNQVLSYYQGLRKYVRWYSGNSLEIKGSVWEM